MSKNIVFEGWLTKSPPTKRIWRAKWRRRWFTLRQSGELPGQYLLDYYADRNRRRLKGTINLDLCEQVDAGLSMERGNGSLDEKFRGSVFTVRTQSRTYHLEAECEEEMIQWVEAICRVCGLRATEDSTDVIGTYQNNSSNAEQLEHPDGVYIPISECITGVRVQDLQTAFTFDPRNIVTSNRFEKFSTRPQATESRLNATDNWDNESNISAEDCLSLNTSQTTIGDGPHILHVVTGPPVPPRPPKTFHGSKLQEPVESSSDSPAPQSSPLLRIPRRLSHGSTLTSPGRQLAPQHHPRGTDDEDEAAAHPSMQYYNMPSLPPAVDRARKPRYRVHSHSIGHIHTLLNPTMNPNHHREGKDVLQYLDLDLTAAKTTPSKPQDGAGSKKLEFFHGKSLSAVDTDCAYKTVDFLKTEAFNITRQDAEASRNTQY